MDQVLRELVAQVSTDRSRRRLQRVGRSHHLANHPPSLGHTLDNRYQHRTPAHERDQVAVERLALMFCIVASEGCFVENPELRRCELQPLTLESPEDLAHQTALDRVRFADDESSVHALEGYRFDSKRHRAGEAGSAPLQLGGEGACDLQHGHRTRDHDKVLVVGLITDEVQCCGDVCNCLGVRAQ